MSVSDVKNAFARVTADGRLQARDVDTVLQSAGAISASEEEAIRSEVDRFVGVVDPDAAAKVSEQLGELTRLRRTVARMNARVETLAPRLAADAQARLAPGTPTETFAGTAIPEAVKEAVTRMLDAGAVAYDVRELKGDPVYDTSHGEPTMTVDGKFNPYGQEQSATDTLAFRHTELTPAGIAEDMQTVQTYRVLAGFDRVDGAQVARFREVTQPGPGTITALYDEASWPDTRARGPQGQKHANNFAILADGSVHCVPASRRSEDDPGRILTTASLARGQHMLFNGHLNMKDGVVTYVGMSGRLCKLAAKGEASFVDPLEILKAWGFELAPGLKVTNEG